MSGNLFQETEEEADSAVFEAALEELIAQNAPLFETRQNPLRHTR